jgi:gliding motility-associated-like protein
MFHRRGLLLLLFLVLTNLKAFAQNENGKYNEAGNSENQHIKKDNVIIAAHSNYNSAAPEGAIVARYESLRHYDGDADNIYNNFGIWKNDVFLYYLNSNQLRTDTAIKKEIGFNVNNVNIISNIPGNNSLTGVGFVNLGDIGPFRSYKITLLHNYGRDGTGFDKDKDFYERTGTTAKLKALVNVKISDFPDEVNHQIYPLITWNKGTNYIDEFVSYEISRKVAGGTFQVIDVIAGDKRSYNDTGLTNSGNYVYAVRTLLSSNAPSDWNRSSDASEPAVESTYAFTSIELTASVDQSNRIRLNWPSLTGIKPLDYIVIYRDGEELAQLSRNVRTYSDADILPGLFYKYTIGIATDGSTVINFGNWRSNEAEGKSLPNGKISGYIKGKTNAGVSGVVVTATAKTPVSDNKTAQIYSYTDTTDADGYYEIANVFYGKGTDYSIKPNMPGYTKNRFEPDSLSRKLLVDDPNKQNVNFTDTASFAISGKVYFASIKDSLNRDIFLPLQDAEVWLNGSNSSVRTKSDGTYSLSIQSPGTHSIQIKYKNHPIYYDNTTDSVKSVQVNKLITDFNFTDRATDTLTIKVAASCDAPIGEYVTLKLNSEKAGFTTGNQQARYGKLYHISAYDWDKGSPKNPGQVKMGEIKVILPATGFEGQVVQVYEDNGINSNKLEYFTRTYNLFKVDVGQRDTTKNIKQITQINTIPADTVFKPDGSIYSIQPSRKDTVITSDTTLLANAPKMEFIYHDQLQVVLNNGNAAFADSVRFKPNNTYKYLLSQNDKHLLNIKIKEYYSYRGKNYNCILDTGTVYIYDAISDIVDRQEFLLDSLTHDVKYTLKVGAPILEAPYQKTIQIVGKVGSRQASQILSVVVEGERARNATFVTKTPEIPLFILHDPPGDKSYTKISKGTTISGSHTTQYAGGAGGGAYIDLKAGIGANLPIKGDVSVGIHVQAEVESGADKNSGKTTSTTMTFTEDFSTSGEETLVGADGDVYVGASMNMVYALTDVLKYDATIQDMVRDTALAADMDDFNTTFLYTEHHIKNILLKQLNTLYSIGKGDFDVAQQKFNNGDKGITTESLAQLNRAQLEYKASIESWEKTLAKNKHNRDKAGVVALPAGTTGVVGDNISLSSGAIYDNTISLQTDTTSFSEVSVYLNGSVKVAAFNQTGIANEKEIGGLATFRFNWSKAKDTTTTRIITTSYHLEDNDLGDYFSINLKKDKEYDTPVFQVVSGSSSCPHEENTQYRHLPAMQTNGANEQRNVPSDQAAKFEILISNRSESDETVEYAIKLDPISNPNGARVLVGGQDVTNGQATYYIPTGKSFKLPVEVFRGSLSSVYEGLSLVIFSTCDNTLDDISEENIAKPSVKLNAYFQNKCSEIDLFIPGNNWLVNQSNGNKLYTAFSKYDASEASPLTSVGLQYRKINQDYENSLWTTIATFPKSVLVDKYYDYTFDVSTLPDGKYELRAIAVCQGVDVNYSPVYSGTIDRVSAVAFGLPTPANGILTTAQVIGVTFNKDVVYTDLVNPVKVTLKRKDNGQLIPASVTGDGRTFIVKTIPESAIGDYENVELTATVKNLIDLNGNKVVDSVSWSFVVNLSPVYWSPTNVTVNAIENVQSNFSAKLLNKSALVQNFSITKYPDWLTPSYKSGKLVALGEQNIDFVVNKNLNTGTYTDTVVAEADNKRQYLYVTLNVLRNPPNWTVNPANFKYNMSVTAQFSLNGTDTLTSKDLRDKMALFVGEECRGVANIVFDRDLNKYVAFITAYSNQPADENMTLRFWDTYPGLEYQAIERLNFVANGVTGNIQSPYITHPEGVYQTIPLKKGWTWISLNVQNSDMTLPKVLASLKPTEGDLIKTLANNNTYSQYTKNMGWVGQLNSLNLYNSYMIYLDKADTLRVLGNFIAQPANVALNKGWNWTGYPMALNLELNTYLKNYLPADGSQLISQEEFAQFNAATNTWSGSLKYLRPGKGYKFYSGSDGFSIPVITYSPTTDPKLEQEQQNQPPVNNPAAPIIVNNTNTTVTSTVNNTSVNTVNYENNSSVTTVINQGGQIVNNTTNRYETYVYVENSLVNIVNQTILPNGQAVGFIPVNGSATDEGKPVQIKVYDKEEKKEYTAKIEQPVAQQADLITGNVATPVVLVLEGLADVKVSNNLEKQQVNKEEEFVYQIKIENAGPDLAVNVVLSDTLATTFDYLEADNGLTYDPVKRTFHANILQLKSGEEQRFNIRLKANRVGLLPIGKGIVTLNNDNNTANNSISQLVINVVDERANSAKLLIPSLFTPNGDGINDRFEIVGLNEFFVSNSLVIFNKNYNQVYRKQNYQNDWTGDNLPMGSYGYILKATDKDNKEVVYKGFVTIVYQ